MQEQEQELERAQKMASHLGVFGGLNANNSLLAVAQQLHPQFTPAPYKRGFGVVDAEVVRTNGVYAAPLSVVVDMWRVAYPDWMSVDDLPRDTQEDRHFMFKRLLDNGCFEQVQCSMGENSKNNYLVYNTVVLYRLREGL